MTRLPGPLSEALRHLRHGGLGAVREFTWRSYLRYGRRFEPDPVFESDWDLLIVLDACRADLWAEVVDGEDDLPVGTTRISPGGTSTEWLESVFGGRDRSDLSEVGYVTANPYSDTHVEEDALGLLDEVWRYAWDDDEGTVRPRPVTDAAIRAGRRYDFDRLVVHYMQPHFPSLSRDGDAGTTLDAFGDEPLSVWDDLRFDRCSVNGLWEAYRENLRIVLRDVRLLLSNFDAPRTVVTADHGNAFGERGIYGHASGIALRPLREVPWAETTATDRRVYEPVDPRNESGTQRANDTDVRDRLRELGYQ
jgi:hypothetical protein